MSTPSADTHRLIAELDDAVQAHMDWTRRIIRCAVLHTAPDADVVDPHAHTLCRFGAWFSSHRAEFDALDATAAAAVEAVHQSMHDAMRTLFACITSGQAGSAADLDAFETSQAELIRLLARFKTQILSATARSDPLTGLPLRYGIENDFERIRKEAGRARAQLYVAMIDIDHFKRINDTYGHLVGDQVLRRLSATLQGALRGNEPLYRYGGEEFLWLLKCASADEARRSAKRALSTVGTTPVALDDGDVLRLTITLGLARAGDAEDFDSVLKRADAALYAGKRSGRNTFVFAED
ncbi:MAG: diguanylate cyclase [Gammaproteobacteria bacterium]